MIWFDNMHLGAIINIVVKLAGGVFTTNGATSSSFPVIMIYS